MGPSQTAAIQHLKNIAQHPLPLRIPTDGQRILQTDASDQYWGAVLLENMMEKNLTVLMQADNSGSQKNTTM